MRSFRRIRCNPEITVGRTKARSMKVREVENRPSSDIVPFRILQKFLIKVTSDDIRPKI